MILQKLAEYYDRLERDPETDVAAFGFSRQKISFEIVLKPDGALVAVGDHRTDSNGRLVARQMVVPGQAKPSGSGVNPCFLWDNAQYLLGFKPEDPKPERTSKAFEAFRDRHLALEAEINDPAFSTVCRFLETWRPERAAEVPDLAELTSAFGVFRLQGATEYVHDRPAVREFWLRQVEGADADAPRAPSLISGLVQPIARLHEPKIKGVRGAQSSGATIVSFNGDAYESYGKSQSFNAPVGVQDAFKYCTALNRLTAGRDRQVHLGDTTVVYWTERKTAFEDDLGFVFEPVDAEDATTLASLNGFFSRLRRASAGAAMDEGGVPFYVLGLSPNAARVSVRFWMVGTVQQFAERLGQHLLDLELSGGPPGLPPITVQRIIDQTARERADIQPNHSGALLQAVLSGGPYPRSVVGAILRRIRADGETGGWTGHIRASFVKAYLMRESRLKKEKEIITMALDENCPRPAYHLGRLFAALEKTQEDALGKELNVTIKDRYFSSASACPVAAFPRLLRLHAHHLDKLGSDKRGMKVNREKLVQQICDRINAAEGFPTHLPLDEQGLFFLGYYHQRADLFTSKKDRNDTTETTEE